MENSIYALDEQAWMLLAIAVSTKQMSLWRGAPEKCIQNLKWEQGVSQLNGCDVHELTIEDIQRIPNKDLDRSLSAIMLKTLSFQYRAVARCIELKAGPGLWLQCVFGLTYSNIESRRSFAWSNMKLDGVDAWALAQYTSPSKSFEESLENYNDVKKHTNWAHRWWLQCALGMDPVQAHAMACCVCTPIHADEMYTVNTELFDTTCP